MTRGDKIRAMHSTDEGLAQSMEEDLWGFECEGDCPEYDPMGKYLGIRCSKKCHEHRLAWLREQVEE